MLSHETSSSQSRQQSYLVNVERANRRRLERADLLACLRGRQLDPVALVCEPPECLRGMFVFDFLRQVPFIGKTKIREINRLAMRDQINLAVEVGEMTKAKRQWLAARIDVGSQRAQGRWPIAARPQG